MNRKIGFGLLWLAFVVYAFGFAPPQQPGTFELIKNLATGAWEGINPLIIALFNIMGIWPMIYSSVMFFDGKGQKLPAWPFVDFSFGVGAFILLPYLAFRQPNPTFSGDKNPFLKLLDSRFTGLFLLLGTSILVGLGIFYGNWTDFVYQWQTSRFIHVMSLDFCLLCLLFPALLSDDMARRNFQNPALFWTTALIPLFGPLIYLCLRPNLPATSEASRVTQIVNS